MFHKQKKNHLSEVTVMGESGITGEDYCVVNGSSISGVCAPCKMNDHGFAGPAN